MKTSISSSKGSHCQGWQQTSDQSRRRLQGFGRAVVRQLPGTAVAELDRERRLLVPEEPERPLHHYPEVRKDLLGPGSQGRLLAHPALVALKYSPTCLFLAAVKMQNLKALQKKFSCVFVFCEKRSELIYC